ncbi:MAG: hypothetical protein GXP62_12435 [Oligoflexia bacterium]|nr:hypothetical protein [Oligoflexia bacterium]
MEVSLTAAALTLALGCASPPPQGVMPDFSLEDVNTASVSYRDTISPRDKLDQISAWYFGHST